MLFLTRIAHKIKSLAKQKSPRCLLTVFPRIPQQNCVANMSGTGEINCFMQAFGELFSELADPSNKVPAAFYCIIPVANPETDVIETKQG